MTGYASAPSPSHLLFDLDGTLVDSCPGILASLGQAINSAGLAPLLPLTSSLVGPPLNVMIARLTGLKDPAELKVIQDAFKAHYDQEGYRQTTPYPGVLEDLPRLARNHNLRIVTNKRAEPTHRILNHLGIRDCFAGIHCVEPNRLATGSKSALVSHLLPTFDIDAEKAWFIGDSHDDAASAVEHGLRFVFAAYGYGHAPEPPPDDMLTIHAFPELLSILEPRDHA